MKFFHGTAKDITDLTASQDICLTGEIEVAEEYAEEAASCSGAGEPRIYVIEARGLCLADEDDVVAVAEKMSWFDPSYWIFQLADEQDVRDALSAQGFDGVQYEDATQNNTTMHDTVRVWRTDKLTLVERR